MEMKLLVEEETPWIDCYIDIVRTFYQPQEVVILVNGEEAFHETVEGDQDISFAFEKPEDPVVELRVLLPDSISPSEVSGSSDKRELSLGLLTMELTGR